MNTVQISTTRAGLIVAIIGGMIVWGLTENKLARRAIFLDGEIIPLKSNSSLTDQRLRKALVGQWVHDDTVYEFTADGRVLVVPGVDRGYRICDKKIVLRLAGFFWVRLMWNVTIDKNRLVLQKTYIGINRVLIFKRRQPLRQLAESQQINSLSSE